MPGDLGVVEAGVIGGLTNAGVPSLLLTYAGGPWRPPPRRFRVARIRRGWRAGTSVPF